VDSDHDGIPSGRVARAARLAGLAGRQGARLVGGRLADAGRDSAAAQDARERRAVALAEELTAQLGKMKGAAMKLGQMLSTVEFAGVPEGERERVRATLASLRDQAPLVPFATVRTVIEREFEAPVDTVFADVDETPVAAASIGQVHRATLLSGDQVAVKVQYPRVADAIAADMRNIGVLLPVLRMIAPGLDGRALLAELRERLADELDYELEAQHQRAVERIFRGHPFIVVPRVHTDLCRRRVLVTDFVDGVSFETMLRLPDAERDRIGEILYRFYFGLLLRARRCAGDPHPGNYLLCPDDRVAFLDFGLMRSIEPEFLEGERALGRAILAGDEEQVHALLDRLGYLPDPNAFEPAALYEQMALIGGWFAPGFRRLTRAYVAELLTAAGSPRSPYFDQIRRQTLPPQALLIRRMEMLLLSTLGELSVGADWGRLAREYIADDPPHTPLGEQDADFWFSSRGPGRGR
jgi:predicted unusual protein kinase regulating ubiquinone biosynthesis (AarF/ABC1/UbiB family)